MTLPHAYNVLAAATAGHRYTQRDLRRALAVARSLSGQRRMNRHHAMAIVREAWRAQFAVAEGGAA